MIWPYWQIGCSGITTALVSGIILEVCPYWQIGRSGITLLFSSSSVCLERLDFIRAILQRKKF
jgi:hypothetical protein